METKFGFIMSRMRKNKVIGRSLGGWACTNETGMSSFGLGWTGVKVARIGDNIWAVAVTEGGQVEAQIRFGVSAVFIRCN
jgi:L-arabinose isomerase